jgi:hypothetical protein
MFCCGHRSVYKTDCFFWQNVVSHHTYVGIVDIANVSYFQAIFLELGRALGETSGDNFIRGVCGSYGLFAKFTVQYFVGRLDSIGSLSEVSIQIAGIW